MKEIIKYLFVFVILLCLPAAVSANNYEETLLGDWKKKRSYLSKAGLDIEAIYTADIMSNVSGGLRKQTDFLGNMDITFTLDGAKAYNIEGSTIFLYLLNNHGERFDADNIGSVQGTNNIEVSNRTTKLYEAWIEQNLFDDRISFKAGLYDLNSEFYVTDSSDLFINPTFGIGTDMSQSGVNGPSIFPTTSLGLRAKWQPEEKKYIMVAAMDGVPGDPAHPDGTHILLGNGDGELYTLEGGWKLGNLRLALGSWYYTSEAEDLLNAAITHHNKGIYSLAEKEISDNGTVFVRMGLANGDVNQTDFAWATGMHIKNIVANRPDGQLGLAISGAHNSESYKKSTSLAHSMETGLEITYSDQLMPWLRIQPDVQYIVNPGTSPNIDNSLVVGLRFEVIL
jgi:porin